MIKPENEAQLIDVIKSAKGPFSIVGGGTRGLARDGERLDCSHLQGIQLYEPGALTMVASAGTPLVEIEAALEAEGQMLAFEPFELGAISGHSGATTIGGVFATNASGARRVSVGAARDYLLGVRFVDGAGTLVKNGGRVMKNVTGYDLVKLMAGAHGTLGVLSEVSFKVLPKPEAVCTLAFSGLDDGSAIRAMSKALGSAFDVTGAVHKPAMSGSASKTCLRLEGFSKSVSYRAEKLRTLLEPFGPGEIIEGAQFWSHRRCVDGRQGDASAALWRIALKPTLAAEFMEKVGAGRELRYEYDFGGGRIWIWADARDIAGIHQALQSQAAKFGGHATLMAGQIGPEICRFQPDVEPIGHLKAGLRARFDPREILNPGLMG